MASLLRLTLLTLIVVFEAASHEVKKIKSNPDGSLAVGFKKGHIISGMYSVEVPPGDSADKREVGIVGPGVKDSVHMQFDAYTMVFSDWDGLFMLGDKVYTDKLGSLYFFHSDDKCTRKFYRNQGSEVVVMDESNLEKSACSVVREKVMRGLDQFLTTPFRYMLSHPTVKLLNTPGFPGGDYVRGVTEGAINCAQFSIIVPAGDADKDRKIQIFGPGVYEEVKMKFDYGTAVFGRWDGYFYIGDKVFSLEPQTLVIEKDDGSCEKRMYVKQGTQVAATQIIPIKKEDCSVLKKKIVSAFEKLVGSLMIMQEEKEYIYSKEETEYISSFNSKKYSKDVSDSSKKPVNGGVTVSSEDGAREGSKYSSKAYSKPVSQGTPEDVDEGKRLKQKDGKVRVIGNDYYPEDEIDKMPRTMSNKFNGRNKINKKRVEFSDDYYDANEITDIEDTMNDVHDRKKGFKRLQSVGEFYDNDGSVKFNAFQSRVLDDDDDNDASYFSGRVGDRKKGKQRRVEDVYDGRKVSDYLRSSIEREYAAYVRNKEQEREQPTVFVTSKVVLPQANDQGRLSFLAPAIIRTNQNNQPIYSSREAVNFISDDSKTNGLQYVLDNGLLVPIVSLENRGNQIYLQPLNLRTVQDVSPVGSSPNIQFTNLGNNNHRRAFNVKTMDTSKRGGSQSVMDQVFVTRKVYLPGNRPYTIQNPNFLQNNGINLVSKNQISQPIFRIQTNENNAVKVQANEIGSENGLAGSVGTNLGNNELSSERLVENYNIASPMMQQRRDEDQLINLQSNKVNLKPGKSLVNIQINKIGKTKNLRKKKK